MAFIRIGGIAALVLLCSGAAPPQSAPEALITAFDRIDSDATAVFLIRMPVFATGARRAFPVELTAVHKVCEKIRSQGSPCNPDGDFVGFYARDDLRVAPVKAVRENLAGATSGKAFARALRGPRTHVRHPDDWRGAVLGEQRVRTPARRGWLASQASRV